MSVVAKKGSRRLTAVTDVSVTSEKKAVEPTRTQQTITKIFNGLTEPIEPEKKQTAPMVFAIIDSQGACVKLAESAALAEQYVQTQRFELSLKSLFGDDAITKFRAALVMPEDALKRCFGPTCIPDIEKKGNEIRYEIRPVPNDDIIAAVSKLKTKA